MELSVNEIWSKLDLLDSGDFAALRRAAGLQLAQCNGNTLRVFYRVAPSVPSWQEEKLFAVCCIYCLWRDSVPNAVPLEDCIGNFLREGSLSDSVSHRVETLLDLRWDDDGLLLSKVVRLIKMLKQKGIGRPDCSALFDDFLHWNSDSQRVQRKWAKSIFSNVQ